MEIQRGAVASSAAHDAHNFIAIGCDDKSILIALGALTSSGGLVTVDSSSSSSSSFPLPIAGLMNYKSPADTANALAELENSASSLGFSIPHPFMVLSFLQLTVIPELRITERGYIDINHGGIIPLFIE